MESKYARASFIDIFKYAFGGFGSNLAFMLAMAYLTYFYTDIFGVSPFVVAGLMMTSRMIDAFTDPLMGMLGDHTRTKLGKYRPWIIFGAPVLGILIFLLFTAPNLSGTAKILYVYVIYIAYSLASTVVNIPYHSLTPVLSEDPNQRTTIVSWKQGIGTVSIFLIQVLTLPVVQLFGGGKQGWALFGALSGVLVTISFWLCAWGGKKYDTVDIETERPKFSLSKQLKLIIKNKPMLMLMIAFGTDVLAGAATMAVNVYYFKYVLNRIDLVPIGATVGMVGGVAILPLLPILSKKLGKKKLYLIGTAISIVPLVILWIKPIVPVAVLLTLFSILGFVMKIPANMGWAMLPECSDYAEAKFGIRGDGTLTSSLTFINKFGMAIGGSLASLLLGTAGFVANAEQTEAVKSMIVFLRFGMPILGYTASLISMSFYEITSEKYAEIREKLDAR